MSDILTECKLILLFGYVSKYKKSWILVGELYATLTRDVNTQNIVKSHAFSFVHTVNTMK